MNKILTEKYHLEDQRPEVRGLDVLLEKEDDTPIKILPDGTILTAAGEGVRLSVCGVCGATDSERDIVCERDGCPERVIDADLPERQEALICPMTAAVCYDDHGGKCRIGNCGRQLQRAPRQPEAKEK